MSNKKSDKRISMTVKEKDIPAGIQPFSQFMIDNRGVDIPEYAFMIQPPNNYIICNAIQYARIKKTIGTQFSFTNFNDSCYLYILDDDKGDNCFFSPNLSNLDSITEYTDNNLVFTFLNNGGSFSTKKDNVKIVTYKRDKKTIFQPVSMVFAYLHAPACGSVASIGNLRAMTRPLAYTETIRAFT